MKYIHFTAWEKSQRYKYKNMPWLRLYIEIIEKYDKEGQEKKFFRIKDLSRANFLCLLCAAGKFNNRIPYKNNKDLRSITGLKKIYLDELIKCNYIVISDDVNKMCTKSEQNVNKMCTKSEQNVNTVTVTVTGTDQSPNNKKAIMSDILKCAEQIQNMKLKKKIHIETIIRNWISTKVPLSLIYDVLKNMISFKKDSKTSYLEEAKNPYKYITLSMETKFKNYNEQNHQKESDQEKNDFMDLVNKLKTMHS